MNWKIFMWIWNVLVMLWFVHTSSYKCNIHTQKKNIYSNSAWKWMNNKNLNKNVKIWWYCDDIRDWKKINDVCNMHGSGFVIVEYWFWMCLCLYLNFMCFMGRQTWYWMFSLWGRMTLNLSLHNQKVWKMLHFFFK